MFGYVYNQVMSNEKGEGITPEVARSDIEKVLKEMDTVGTGSDLDRAAQMILQTMSVVKNRLDNPEILKILYLDNPGASKLLPDIVLNTVKGVSNGDITPDEAKNIIDQAVPEYIDVFKSLGVTPQSSQAFFSKNNL